MEHIVFEYPWWFLLPVVYFVCTKFCKAKSEALYFPANVFFKKVYQKSNITLHILKFMIIFLFTIALASPVVEDKITTQNDKGYEISMIMDASGSMQEHNKFGIVKNILKDFLDKLGLTIFADFAYVAVPLTYDKKSIKRLLSRLEVGIAGRQRTSLYEALFLSSNLFKESTSKHKIAILLTDGVDNTNTIPLDVAIKTVQKYGIKVYTIGIGNEGDFNPMVLEKIAKESGGEFFTANSVEKLQQVYDKINTLEKSEIKADKYVKKTYYFPYPLSLALALLILLFYIRNRGVS